MDAGSRTGHPDAPMAPAGLRQDQIAAVQDSMETLKAQLADMKMDTGEIMDDIEFVTDPNADHDNYSKAGKVAGAIKDIIKTAAVWTFDQSPLSPNFDAGGVVPHPRDVKKENYDPATKFNEVRARVEQQNEKESEELDIDDVANQSSKKKIKLDKKKTEIKINPDVDIGQISGGTQTGTGNLH